MEPFLFTQLAHTNKFTKPVLIFLLHSLKFIVLDSTLLILKYYCTFFFQIISNVSDPSVLYVYLQRQLKIVIKKNIINLIYSIWSKTCSATIIISFGINTLSEIRNTDNNKIIANLLNIFLAMFYSAMKRILGPLKNTFSLLWIFVTNIYSTALNAF